MTITVPYKIGDKIITETGDVATIQSLHIYINKDKEVSNIRAYAGANTGYVVLLKTEQGEVIHDVKSFRSSK